jgi:hypothetical protein
MNSIHPATTPSPLEVSPVLEYGSPTPLSTHWMPLHELIACWMEAQTLLYPIPLAPLLSAVGHALFALSQETRALRLWIQAGSHEQQGLPSLVIRQRHQQVLHHVQEAAQHWSRAACMLESLRPRDLDDAALARVRQLSRIARTQQERLWQLTKEVQRGEVRSVCQSPAEEGGCSDA